jgi:hypothetical protein
MGNKVRELIVKFKGNEADAHQIDAVEGSNSLVGISAALQRIGHFAATGIIRKKSPYRSSIRFYLDVPRQGSLEFPYHLTILDGATFISSNLGTGIVSSAIWDLIKFSFAAAIGKHHKPTTPFTKYLESSAGGNIEALIDAIEPSIRQAHTAVNSSAKTIYIITGNDNVTLNNFDANSKDYVQTTIRGQLNTIDVSVGALHANQRTGRVFYAGWGKTVPFNVAPNAPSRTIEALSWGLDAYVRASGGMVRIKYEPLRAADDRVKRLVIYEAESLKDAV